MADLTLKIGGDASGASQAIHVVADNLGELNKGSDENAEKIAKASEKWKLFAEVLKGAAEKLVEFGKESVAAFTETERTEAQLRRVAGEATDAFKAQAAAFQEHLGVSDDMVMRIQTMLLTFGEAPADVQATTQAILDYSAATGTDAVAATSNLIGSAKSGRNGFKDLNLEFENTGTALGNVTMLTEKLSAKLGGAAELEADTLTGRTRKFSAAWEDVQKTFGAFVVDVESKTGILEKLSESLKGLNTFVTGGDDKTRRDTRTLELRTELESITGFLNARSKMDLVAQAEQDRLIEEAKARGGSEQDINEILIRRASILSQLATIAAQAKIEETLSTKPGGPAGSVGMGAGAGTGSKWDVGEHLKGVKLSEGPLSAWDKDLEEQANALKKRILDSSNELDTLLLKENEEWAKDLQTNTNDLFKAHEREVARESALVMDAMFTGRQNVRAEEKLWADLGTAIGGAFVNGFTAMINKLSAGGELDAGEVFGQIFSSILAVAGSIIGSYFGGAAGGQIGGAVGSLAGAGVQALTKRRPTDAHHSGGWIDIPRYHDGAWVGADEQVAILQHGERVLSQDNVARMGGPAAVDAAARGGGAINITVQTIDALSSREYFERQGGRALYDALRTGRGVAPFLFGNL